MYCQQNGVKFGFSEEIRVHLRNFEGEVSKMDFVVESFEGRDSKRIITTEVFRKGFKIGLCRRKIVEVLRAIL